MKLSTSRQRPGRVAEEQHGLKIETGFDRKENQPVPSTGKLSTPGGSKGGFTVLGCMN